MDFNGVSIGFMSGVDIDFLLENNKNKIINPRAIITPHAGYIYSGDVAASVFNTIDKEYDNIFILSTSHTVRYSGAGLINENYFTPYGEMIINKTIIDELLKHKQFEIMPEVFTGDHTIEVVLPFIQKKIKYKYIIPIMIGEYNIERILKISDNLKEYFNDNNLFVISSDFSHYPNYEDAYEIDNETFKIIESNDEKLFIDYIFSPINKLEVSTRMCGWSSYLILLHIISKEDIKINKIKYKNSGDTIYAGKESVVGYFGITFT